MGSFVNMMNYQTVFPLILGSNSVIRRKLLENVGIDFFTESNDGSAEELEKNIIEDSSLKPEEMCLKLAQAKAKSYGVREEYVLCVDQLCLDNRGRYLHKPTTKKQAKQQLKNLSGQFHYLYTAATIFLKGKEIWHISQKNSLKMRLLSDDFVNTYIEKIDSDQLFSSGVYCLEKEGAVLFTCIEGDYFSVLGLPLLPLIGFLTDTA